MSLYDKRRRKRRRRRNTADAQCSAGRRADADEIGHVFVPHFGQNVHFLEKLLHCLGILIVHIILFDSNVHALKLALQTNGRGYAGEACFQMKFKRKKIIKTTEGNLVDDSASARADSIRKLQHIIRYSAIETHVLYHCRQCAVAVGRPFEKEEEKSHQS